MVNESERLQNLDQSEQTAVIEWVFQQHLVSFANKLNMFWQGINLDAVYEDFAKELEVFSVGAIKYATERAKKEQYPPRAIDMAKFCREYQPPQSGNLRLVSKITPEQAAKNRERMAEIKMALAEKMRVKL